MFDKELTREHFLLGIFGNRHRLDIWGAVSRFTIDPPERFFTKQLQSELRSDKDMNPSSVFNEIQNLERLGMIQRIDTPSHDRRVLYERTESPAWAIVAAAMSAVDIAFPPSAPAK